MTAYVHKCVGTAHIFVNRILQVFRKKTHKKSITLDDEFKKDLAWFTQYPLHGLRPSFSLYNVLCFLIFLRAIALSPKVIKSYLSSLESMARLYKIPSESLLSPFCGTICAQSHNKHNIQDFWHPNPSVKVTSM